MEKQRKWQLALILAVIALTVYNILPTVFYYTKPLKSPVGESQALQVAQSIASRVNEMETEATDWIGSYCDLLRVKPASISIDPKHPQWVTVQFLKDEDAKIFRSFMPRAGSLIPFVPAQLSAVPDEIGSKTVLIQRRIPLRFEPKSLERLFAFTSKTESDGALSASYIELVLDRAAEIASAAGGLSESASLIQAIQSNHPTADAQVDWLLNLSAQVRSVSDLFEEHGAIQSRLLASLTQGTFADRNAAFEKTIAAMDSLRDRLKREKSELQQKPQDLFLAEGGANAVKLIEEKESSLLLASAFLKKHRAAAVNGKDPLEHAAILSQLRQSAPRHATDAPHGLLLADRNPYFRDLAIDWSQGKISLRLHDDILRLKSQWTGAKKDRLEQLLINEVARLSRLSDENFMPAQTEFTIQLHDLPNAESFLVFRLDALARDQVQQLRQSLLAEWHPQHPDLSPANFPIVDAAGYQSLSPIQKKLCLVVAAPVAEGKEWPTELRAGSLFVLAKGVDRILSQRVPDSELSKTLDRDFKALSELLRRNGFMGYPGSVFSHSNDLANDYVFERTEYFGNMLAATREDFHVHGSKKYAVLEFSDLEQRILAQNRLETRMHEDLLKWRDEYTSAQVSLEPHARYDVPKPTQSVLWSNLKLGLRKYIRGDDRKIIRWGLDLSGGKTVQIELRDQNNRVVTSESDLKQGVNELYNRVNKMGVSEVSIRQAGRDIVLDFPGSQALTAAELVQASSMVFHIVNEKFSTQNQQIGIAVNRFLQEVWNEAVVLNRKDPESINAIAMKHLYGESGHVESAQPRSESARLLFENGLRFSQNGITSSAVNDSLSKIAMLRGKDFNEWHGQNHPLLIVFSNYALEGSNLSNIHSGYDASKGHFLSFEVKGSTTSREGARINPRDELYSWTSKFSQERILGTPNEIHSSGHGWRMAVVLNGSVISAPTLQAALRDSAVITGNFTQREVNQLSSDLKAGSLTFTPHILSEKNVSPELGKSDRAKGIGATFAALCLVIAAMVTYYRFSGLVASIAVLFNLLMMWAILQNLQATLTLAGLAAAILTVAIAVDANVLVFERFKEEFAVSKRIGPAMLAGYKKAFSAILDSNATTLIAALILLNFDAGPIKSFATMLIIGIASSMFSALFMTRYYFLGWSQNPLNKTLQMANWIRGASFDFLKRAKWAFAIAGAIILIGGALVVKERSSLLGMDFTGGFSLNFEVQPDTSIENYSKAVEEAFMKQGAAFHDFQIRELNPSNSLRVLFATSMEQNGKPFAGLSAHSESGHTNPRIEWVIHALAANGIALSETSRAQIDANWTAMSGQMSDTMRNNALIGLLIAFICIFVYITIRFEAKYAASAIVCVLHDVFITLGLIGILHACGAPVQIDLNTVAALMTIVGYSLNDTIIIFDRIREEIRLKQNFKLTDIVNHALNATLNRTAITSGTTLLVLSAMLILGGPSIFTFALTMTIGVVFGTLSSWFIAAPLMLYFHRRETRKAQILEV